MNKKTITFFNNYGFMIKLKINDNMKKKIEYDSEVSSSEDFENLSEDQSTEEAGIKFEKDYQKIKEMRKSVKAPVDSMGSALCPDKTIQETDYKTYKFQALISLLLSSQTKDNITFQATKNLISYGLSISSMLKTPKEKIVEFIYQVSFHNNKAENIKNIAKEIHEKYKDDPPEELSELVKLKGIGYKMALIYLKDVCGKIEGIAVDTHIHKIANRLGWAETKTPEKTRKRLEEIIDKKYWEEMNPILVGFGQEICKSVKPKCSECTLKNNCEWYKEELKRQIEKEKAKVVNKSKSECKSKSKKRRKTK